MQNQSARAKRAAKLLDIGVSTFWRYARERADFPKPRRLSARCTLWDEPELLAWRDAHLSTGAK